MKYYTFFWHGPFSQWHLSDFIVDGVKYNCAEQYMMAGKAKLFNDDESLEKIMKTKVPKEQKVLGRSVKNFDPKIWDENCKDIVYAGNFAKFSQNKDLQELLLNTIGTQLVEASPYDTVWGIGLGPEDPLRLDPKNWKGTNYLGQVLNKVRAGIISSILHGFLYQNPDYNGLHTVKITISDLMNKLSVLNKDLVLSFYTDIYRGDTCIELKESNEN